MFTNCQAQINFKIKSAQSLLKFGTIIICKTLILILMSKIVFIKYLLPVRPKSVPKLKSSEFFEIWHIRYFKYTNFDFNIKNNFYEIFTTCQAQISSKIKSVQSLLKFGTFNISKILILILMTKIVFIKYLPAVRPKLVLKLKIFRVY